MSQTVSLSIIVVNWNTKQLTLQCLESIFAEHRNDFEVILVDNHSHDGSVEAVRTQFPQVRLIANNDNLGFAKANNQGIEIAQGRYILLLNSDTIVNKGSLSGMVSWMDDRPHVGVSTCKLLNKDGTVQATGGYFPTLSRVFMWMFFLDDLPFFGRFFGSYHPHEPSFYTNDRFYGLEHEMDWVTGAFLLFRQEIREKVGVMDDQFFMYAEEMEFCYRIKQKGYAVWYTPAYSIVHLGRQSSTTGSRGALIGEYKGISYFYRKHKPGWEQFVLRVLLKLGAALRILLFGIIMGKKEVSTIYAEAFRVV